MSTLEETLAEVHRCPIFVCIRLDSRERALRAARAVLEGGLAILEVTLTTPDALAIIEDLASSEAGALVGAGTVLTAEDARRVAAAGGRFALSPVTDPEVLHVAHEEGLLFAPGTATPSEIWRAHRAGAHLVKVFPAGALGGPAFIRAVRGPLPGIPLLPTNGVGLADLPAYFQAGAVAVGVGGEILAPELVEAGDWGVITARARAFAEALKALNGA